MSKIYFGGMLLITMSIYFTMLSFIVASGLNLELESQQNMVINDVGDGYQYIQQFGGECNIPRTYYDPRTLDTREVSSGRGLQRIECENSPGVQSPDMCNAIQGCSWNTTSSGWWIWREEYDTCLGTINGSAYDIETEIVFGYERIQNHENSIPGRFWNVCTHPEVIYNQSMCVDIFGCNWMTIEDKLEIQIQHTNVIRTFGNLLSFQYDWGFENQFIATLINFLLVVIPMLLVLIAIYSLIPFI